MEKKPGHPEHSEGSQKDSSVPPQNDKKKSKETGGPKGPEPTRYGDWEIGGKCVDF